MLEYQSTVEDVAISKIIRMAKKDIEDLNQIIPMCNKDILENVIQEVIN